MSTKENAAVSQLLALLEARYALRCSGPCATAMRRPSGCCRTASAASPPTRSTPASRNCAEAGIVSHGNDGYCLTLTGQDLLKRLSDLQAFAGKWQGGPARKAGHGSAARHQGSRLPVGQIARRAPARPGR